MDDARIRQLLGGEFAQEDPNFAHYALRRDDILRTLDDPSRRLVVVNAPRGSGKSGLLIKHAETIRLASPSSNIVIAKFLQDLDYPDTVAGEEGAIRFWKRRLLEWAVEEIGARIDLPVDRAEQVAVEIAERAGRRRNSAAPPGAPLANVPDALLEDMVSASRFSFWFLLDEMDDLFDDSDYKRNRLAGLLYSAKALLRIQNVRVRITVRPHIMTILRTHYSHVQQVRANELPVTWTSKQLKQLLARRLVFAAKLSGGHQLDLLQSNAEDTPEGVNAILHRHFDDFDMSFTEGKGRNYQQLHTVSLGRPRWMLEFCALALGQSGGERATASEYRKAMHLFGNNRIQFLSGEHKFHAPKLEAAINGLAGAQTMKFRTSSALRMAIERHILNVEPTSHRRAGDPVAEEALEIARLLFMTEFLRAREGTAREYRFYRYSDRPSLLASWQSSGRIGWEIHPIFGLALNIVDNRTFTGGGEVRLHGERLGHEDIQLGEESD